MALAVENDALRQKLGQQCKTEATYLGLGSGLHCDNIVKAPGSFNMRFQFKSGWCKGTPEQLFYLSQFKAILDQAMPTMKTKGHSHNLLFRDATTTSILAYDTLNASIVGGIIFRLTRIGSLDLLVLNILAVAVLQSDDTARKGIGSRLVESAVHCAGKVRQGQHETFVCFAQADSNTIATNFWLKQRLSPSVEADLMLDLLVKLDIKRTRVYDPTTPMLRNISAEAWHCTQCEFTSGSRRGVLAHMRLKHGMDTDTALTTLTSSGISWPADLRPEAHSEKTDSTPVAACLPDAVGHIETDDQSCTNDNAETLMHVDELLEEEEAVLERAYSDGQWHCVFQDCCEAFQTRRGWFTHLRRKHHFDRANILATIQNDRATSICSPDLSGPGSSPSSAALINTQAEVSPTPLHCALEPEQNFACTYPGCDRHCKTKPGLVNHMRLKHGVQSRQENTLEDASSPSSVQKTTSCSPDQLHVDAVCNVEVTQSPKQSAPQALTSFDMQQPDTYDHLISMELPEYDMHVMPDDDTSFLTHFDPISMATELDNELQKAVHRDMSPVPSASDALKVNRDGFESDAPGATQHLQSSSSSTSPKAAIACALEAWPAPARTSKIALLSETTDNPDKAATNDLHASCNGEIGHGSAIRAAALLNEDRYCPMDDEQMLYRSLPMDMSQAKQLDSLTSSTWHQEEVLNSLDQYAAMETDAERFSFVTSLIHWLETNDERLDLTPFLELLFSIPTTPEFAAYTHRLLRAASHSQVYKTFVRSWITSGSRPELSRFDNHSLDLQDPLPRPQKAESILPGPMHSPPSMSSLCSSNSIVSKQPSHDDDPVEEQDFQQRTQSHLLRAIEDRLMPLGLSCKQYADAKRWLYRKVSVKAFREARSLDTDAEQDLAIYMHVARGLDAALASVGASLRSL